MKPNNFVGLCCLFANFTYSINTDKEDIVLGIDIFSEQNSVKLNFETYFKMTIFWWKAIGSTDIWPKDTLTVDIWPI